MEIEVGTRVSVATPGQVIDGRVINVNTNTVEVILANQEFPIELFVEEIDVRRVRAS